jgi:hypothetical protein
MGNNDGPHDAIFKKQDAETVGWAQSLLAHSIVTDSLGIQYERGNNVAMNQTALFRQIGFYCKALPLISPAAYAIVMNTNLGGSNAVQMKALSDTLQWIHTTHANTTHVTTAVYILGHHPAVMKQGVNIAPAQFRHMVKGTFAGHVHFASTTSDSLFTQVPAVSQHASDTAFWIASVGAATNYTLRVDKGNRQEFHRYTGPKNQEADSSKWSPATPTPLPTPPPPTPPPTPPPPTPPPTPAPPTPPRTPAPPTPALPTPGGHRVWDCHTKTTTTNAMKLADRDLGGADKTLQQCEQSCDRTTDCEVVYFHTADKHCHVLIGAVARSEYEKTLKKEKSYTTCIAVAQEDDDVGPTPPPLTPTSPPTPAPVPPPSPPTPPTPPTPPPPSPPAAKCDPATFLQQTDFHHKEKKGFDVASNNATQCCLLCQQRSGCKFFSFAVSHKHCYFKLTDGGQEANPDVISGWP